MLLTTLNRTKQVSMGNLKWIDEMIIAREKLITSYFKLLTLPIDRNDTYSEQLHPSYEQVEDFCGLVIDYLSRGHFEIYPKILAIMENVSNRRMVVARRLLPRIFNTTDHITDFTDKYSENLDEEKMDTLRNDLGIVGQWLEIRFKHEDRMVIALQIMDNKLAKAASQEQLIDKN
jgi:regulator of sigma D